MTPTPGENLFWVLNLLGIAYWCQGDGDLKSLISWLVVLWLGAAVWGAIWALLVKAAIAAGEWQRGRDQ